MDQGSVGPDPTALDGFRLPIPRLLLLLALLLRIRSSSCTLRTGLLLAGELLVFLRSPQAPLVTSPPAPTRLSPRSHPLIRYQVNRSNRTRVHSRRPSSRGPAPARTVGLFSRSARRDPGGPTERACRGPRSVAMPVLVAAGAIKGVYEDALPVRGRGAVSGSTLVFSSNLSRSLLGFLPRTERSNPPYLECCSGRS